MNCPNCNREMTEAHKFQAMLICPDCFKIVSHFIQRAKTEMQQVFLVYTDMLRVALAKGELRPPVLPPGDHMPATDFRTAMRHAMEVQDGNQAEESKHHRDMPGVRYDAQDRRPRIPSRPGFEAVRGRRKLREVPPVQEAPSEDHKDP